MPSKNCSPRLDRQEYVYHLPLELVLLPEHVTGDFCLCGIKILMFKQGIKKLVSNPKMSHAI